MEIKYLGQSAFYVKSKDGSRLVTDPFDPEMVGIKFPKTETDIITISHHHKDHDYIKAFAIPPLVFDWPGQFEAKGIRITGYKNYHDEKKGAERGEIIVYKIELDQLSLLHCGDLGTVPEDAFIDNIGDVDILMVPVGGKYTLDGAGAVSLIKKIEPSIVIPMHYKISDKIEGLAPVADFLKKIGAEQVVPVPKLVVKKEDLGDEMKVVVMEI